MHFEILMMVLHRFLNKKTPAKRKILDLSLIFTVSVNAVENTNKTKQKNAFIIFYLFQKHLIIKRAMTNAFFAFDDFFRSLRSV